MSLSFGAMVPDLEVLALMPFTSEPGHARGLMHSFLGAFSLDILVALAFAYFLVPPVGRWVKRRSKEKWHIFAGVDVTRAPRDPLFALASAGMGTVSHVLIDLFTHEYNPIFWPYRTSETINLMPVPDSSMSTLAVAGPLLIIALVLALRYWSRPFK